MNSFPVSQRKRTKLSAAREKKDVDDVSKISLFISRFDYETGQAKLVVTYCDSWGLSHVGKRVSFHPKRLRTLNWESMFSLEESTSFSLIWPLNVAEFDRFRSLLTFANESYLQGLDIGDHSELPLSFISYMKSAVLSNLRRRREIMRKGKK